MSGFGPNGSGPEASQCARIIRPASGQCFSEGRTAAGPDTNRTRSGMFTGNLIKLLPVSRRLTETMLHSSCCMWRHFVITQLRLREGGRVGEGRQRQTDTDRQTIFNGTNQNIVQIFGITDFSQSTKNNNKKRLNLLTRKLAALHRRGRTPHFHEVMSPMSVVVVLVV